MEKVKFLGWQYSQIDDEDKMMNPCMDSKGNLTSLSETAARCSPGPDWPNTHPQGLGLAQHRSCSA